MAFNYLLIRPDEDGNPLRWLANDGRDLRELLRDPKSSYGVDRFLGEDPFSEDPNYWPDGTGLLIRYEVVVPAPSGAYQLPDEPAQG